MFTKRLVNNCVKLARPGQIMHKLPGSDRVNTAQKIKFSIKDFFSKCEQIRSFLMIWSYLLNKSLMENFIFCAV